MTTHESDIITFYAREINMDRKIVERVYMKGSPTQRGIDLVAMEVTLYLKRLTKAGMIQVDKYGKPKDKVKVDKYIREFLRDKDNLPDFFRKPLPKPKNETPQAKIPAKVEAKSQEQASVDKKEPERKVEEKT